MDKMLKKLRPCYPGGPIPRIKAFSFQSSEGNDHEGYYIEYDKLSLPTKEDRSRLAQIRDTTA